MSMQPEEYTEHGHVTVHDRNIIEVRKRGSRRCDRILAPSGEAARARKHQGTAVESGLHLLSGTRPTLTLDLKNLTG
jgi:hypothetical protein